jgi:hypothetical protein
VNGPKPTPSPQSIQRSWLRLSDDVVRASETPSVRMANMTAAARNPIAIRSSAATAPTGSSKR